MSKPNGLDLALLFVKAKTLCGIDDDLHYPLEELPDTRIPLPGDK
jgi:hypothetical protein